MPTLRRMPAPTAASSTRWVGGAIGVAVLAASASVLAVVLVLAGNVWDLPAAPQVLVDAAVGATCPVMAVVIATARNMAPRPLASVLLISGTAAALAALTTALALVLPAGHAAAGALVQLQSWIWVPGFLPLLTLVPLLYPDGLLPGWRWRAAAFAAVAGTVLLAVGVGLYPETFAGQVPITKPVTSETLATVLAVLAALLLVPAGAAGLASQALRLRRASGLARRQVWVLLAAASVLLGVTLAQGLLPSPVDVLAQTAAVVLVPVAIGVAVTRHDLYELDTAVRSAVVAASLAVCLGALYLTLFSVVSAVLPDRSVLGAAVAAGATGALVQPLARRLTAGVDRLFYGDRADPYAVLARVTGELSAVAGLDVDRVPDAVADAVVDSLRLPGAEVVLDAGDGQHRLAGAGVTVPGDAPSFELRHRGTLVGRLRVLPRPGEVELHPKDDKILVVVAEQVAPALAALRLQQDLQRSREQLVNAREEERRRLRRELHDGLGATLAGVRLQVESARALVDDPAAQALLDAAGAGVAQAVAEVRHVCQGLRPPSLDDLGLVRAIRMATDRVNAPVLQVTFTADDLPNVGPAVEAATYRITTEALANAVRHADAHKVAVTLAIHDNHLELEVRDNGRGIPQTADERRTGTGIASMRQRAEELGGLFRLESLPGRGGTLVRASFPLTEEVA